MRLNFKLVKKCLTFQNEFDILQKFAERAKSFTANKSKKLLTNNERYGNISNVRRQTKKQSGEK